MSKTGFGLWAVGGQASLGDAKVGGVFLSVG
jgi:hypothetical protein